MGTRWRRLNERVKQKIIAKGKFVATSNRRCEMMYQEAGQFAEQLRKLEENLRRLQENIEVMLSDTRNVMLCTLPCTYDFTPSGQAVPEDPDPQLIGQNVQLDRFSAASQILRQKLEEEVMEPLRCWLQGFEAASEQMRQLEDLRLELDSRRRTVDSLYIKVEKQQSQLDIVGSKIQSAHETTVRYLQHKEKKKNATMSTFQEQESLMYQNLYTLIKDTTCFKEYTGLAYGILQNAFSVAHGAFPLHKNDTRLLTYGDLGSRVAPSTPGPLSVRSHTHTIPMPKEFRQSLAIRSAKNINGIFTPGPDSFIKDDNRSVISEKLSDYNKLFNERKAEQDNIGVGRYGWN